MIVVVAWLASIGVASAQPGEAPGFAFRFDGGPSRIETAPNGRFEQEVYIVIETINDPLEPAERGAQGWSFSISGYESRILDVSLDGTVSASIDDDPPGLLDAGFSTSSVGDGDHNLNECEGRQGAVGAVVLSFIRPVTLPLDQIVPVARVTIGGRGPDEIGVPQAASLRFVDGCAGHG